MRKTLALILAAMLIWGAMPALGEDAPVNLKIMIRHIGYDTDYFNTISQELNKRCNVNVEWILSPGENYAQQCTMALMGDLPDAMEYACSQYPNDIRQLAEDGLIIPLDDLLKEYGQNILETRKEDYLWYTADDGHVYAISCRQQEYSNHVWQIRQDWLDKLGLQMPSTLDEFHDVLVAFRDNAALLVGEGKQLIPYGNCQGNKNTQLEELVYGAYGFIGGWNDVDGQAVYYINHPRFKEALRTIRQWQQEGLIDPEWPLCNREQNLEKWYKGIYGAFGNLLDNTDPAWHVYIPIFMEKNPEAQLSFVMPFPSEDGKGRIQNTTTWNQMVIFSDTTEEQRIALMKLFDYMISPEGSDLVEMGIEGENWSEIGDTGRADFFPLETDAERADLGYYSFNWCMKRHYFPRWNSETVIGTGAAYAEHLAFPCVIAVTPAQQEYGTVLSDLISSRRTALILEPDIDFDAEFDKFVQDWNQYGGAQWTEEMNAVYQQKKAQ